MSLGLRLLVGQNKTFEDGQKMNENEMKFYFNVLMIQRLIVKIVESIMKIIKS